MKLVYKKICIGLYINHATGFTISHDATWDIRIGRRWEAKAVGVSGLCQTRYEERRSFSTMAEARVWLDTIYAGMR